MQSCTAGQGLQRFGRPDAARGIHMCVSEQANLGLHPRVRGYKGLAEQLLPVVAVSTHTHVCVCANAQQKSRLQGFGRPTSTGSTQTENSRRISQYRVASKARVTKAWPTKCGQRTHEHVPSNLSVGGCTQGSGPRRFGRPSAAASIHMCIAEIRVASRGRNYTTASPATCC